MKKGINAEVPTKSVNAPDTNLLDFGFYAVQSANDEVASSEGEMIKHIQQTFDQYPRQKFNGTWLTYMSSLNMIIDHLGDNNYKIPYMNKSKMEWEGTLPMVLQVTDAVEPLMEMMETMTSIDEEDMDKEENDLENTL